jgi:hypothetical protein
MGSVAILLDMKPGNHGRRIAAAAAVLVSTLLGVSQVAAQVAAQEPAPDPFVVLFSITCMKYYNSADQLRAAMKASGSAEMTGDAAAFFLNGKIGSAWRVPVEGKPYIVTLRQDGICTVFAQKADIEAVRKDFTRLVSRATPPVEARSLPGGPGGTVVQTITYAWARPTDDVQLVFTLTTSTSPSAPVEAMATVALTAK